MQLGLTFPLQRKLKIKFVPYGTPLERLYCWDLHCITLRGQDSLLLVHCASRYTVVVCGVTGFDWQDLPGFAMEQTRSGLLENAAALSRTAGSAAAYGSGRMGKGRTVAVGICGSGRRI